MIVYPKQRKTDMDKIEKIRQEIERRKNYISVTHFAEELLSFLDTLSEEPDKSLEEAARLYAIPHYMKDIDVNHIEEYPYDTGLEAAFIAGAKWGAEHIKK